MLILGWCTPPLTELEHASEELSLAFRWLAKRIASKLRGIKWNEKGTRLNIEEDSTSHKIR